MFVRLKRQSGGAWEFRRTQGGRTRERTGRENSISDRNIYFKGKKPVVARGTEIRGKAEMGLYAGRELRASFSRETVSPPTVARNDVGLIVGGKISKSLVGASRGS